MMLFLISEVARSNTPQSRRGRGHSRIIRKTATRLWIVAGLLLAANWAYLLLWGVAV